MTTAPTFLSISHSTGLTINTAFSANVGTYSLLVIGNISPYTATSTQSFTLTITDLCPSAIITSTAVSSQIYYITGSKLITNVTAYTSL